MRPLTARQERALTVMAAIGVTDRARPSMPSLERRGLVQRDWAEWYGRRFRTWTLTAAGVAEVKRITERRTATAKSALAARAS